MIKNIMDDIIQKERVKILKMIMVFRTVGIK